MKKLFVFTVVIALFSSCSDRIQSYTASQFALGTVCDISIWHYDDTVLQEAFNVIHDTELIFSKNIAGTEISKINAAAGLSPVKVSAVTFDLLKRSLELAEATDGKFDITIGSLVNLWGIGTDKARIPEEQEILEVLHRINYQQLLLDEENQTAFLSAPGMQIDVGGIAKGLAADLARDYLAGQGVQRAIINLGGDVLLLGEKEDGPWRIGIQHPDAERGRLFGIVETSENAVVTSGKYERFFLHDGLRYHHIFDPQTGYPVENGISSASVIMNDCMLADALSTAILVLGLEKSFELYHRLGSFEMIIVLENGNVYISDGLKENFHLSADGFFIQDY